MATLPATGLSAEQYLELDRHSERRLEYRHGEVFPIEAATLNHARIRGNFLTALRARLLIGACEALPGDIRVEIPRFNCYVYPDLLIASGTLELADKHADTLLNPTVVVEVLSPSTEGFDRGEKFTLYQSLPSVQEYVLISQDRVLVELYRRQNDRQWLYEAISTLDAELALNAPGCSVPLQEIYANISVASPSLTA